MMQYELIIVYRTLLSYDVTESADCSGKKQTQSIILWSSYAGQLGLSNASVN